MQMICAESRTYFEVFEISHIGNTMGGRLFCLKDFLKKCALLPLSLLAKGIRTFFKAIGLLFAAALVLFTIGSIPAAREFFLTRIALFAKDLADWLLLPFAILIRILRLSLALLIHPKFYFNSFS
jgi:hypothetical protein